MRLATSCFIKQEAGNIIEIGTDIVLSDNARPFVVKISSSNISHCCVLVYAADEKHAIKRVNDAIMQCDGREARYIKDLLKHNVALFDIEPLDTRLMPEIQWAINGGII